MLQHSDTDRHNLKSINQTLCINNSNTWYHNQQVPIQARKINTRFLAIESLQQLVEPQDSVQQIHCIHTDCGTRTARVVKKLSENC